MNIIITGSTGFVASHFIDQLSEHNLGLLVRQEKSKPISDNITHYLCNLTDQAQIHQAFVSFHPDVIIHAAAMTDVDYCESHLTEANENNILATENLIAEAQRHHAKIIYLSTDFVFDGKEGSYSTNCPTNPINFYGWTKARSEDKIIASGLPYTILRIAYPYGSYLEFAHKDKMTQLCFRVRNRLPLKAVTDQFFTPTYIPDIVCAIKKCLTSHNQRIFHVASPEIINWLGVTLMLQKLYGHGKATIDTTTYEEYFKGKKRAPRPLNSSLATYESEQDLGFKFTTISEGVSLYLSDACYDQYSPSRN